MGSGIFKRSRLQLTFAYSLVMFAFLATLLAIAYKAMDWSIFSEQEKELRDATENIANAQTYYSRWESSPEENQIYRNSNDRLFFYVFDEDGRLLNFSRASFKIETFILDVISRWSRGENEIEYFLRSDANGQINRVMITSRKVPSRNILQTIYVGKDISALYYGMQRATYVMVFLAFVALIFSSLFGYFLAGRAMQPIEEAYERQRQFAADASHELRTPLAVIMASTDVLRNDPSIKEPFLKQVIEDVRDEVKKMTNLVSDLLTVVRSENNALKLDIQKLDLSLIIEQQVRIMQALAEKKSITLTAENLIPLEIQADEQKIKQLVLILVDNAVKYTPDNGSVTVKMWQVNKARVAFSVEDTGIGISAEDKDKIFDRFFRVDKARSRAMGGNGLGLAIALEIVRMHHGNITVDSVLGSGTKFTVELRTKF